MGYAASLVVEGVVDPNRSATSLLWRSRHTCSGRGRAEVQREQLAFERGLELLGSDDVLVRVTSQEDDADVVVFERVSYDTSDEFDLI